MADAIFGIATSALRAAQAGLATAGHNIANANTNQNNASMRENKDTFSITNSLTTPSSLSRM